MFDVLAGELGGHDAACTAAQALARGLRVLRAAVQRSGILHCIRGGLPASQCPGPAAVPHLHACTLLEHARPPRRCVRRCRCQKQSSCVQVAQTRGVCTVRAMRRSGVSRALCELQSKGDVQHRTNILCVYASHIAHGACVLPLVNQM